MNTQEIFDNALHLSVNERFQLLEALELSITPTRLEIDREWTAVARQRLADFNSGKTQAVSSDEVFSEIRGQFTDDNQLSS